MFGLTPPEGYGEFTIAARLPVKLSILKPEMEFPAALEADLPASTHMKPTVPPPQAVIPRSTPNDTTQTREILPKRLNFMQFLQSSGYICLAVTDAPHGGSESFKLPLHCKR